MGRTRVGFQNQLGEGIHVGLFFPLDFRLSKGRAKAISRTASLANCKGIEAVFPRLSVADRPNPCEGIRPFAPKVVVLLFRLSPSEQVCVPHSIPQPGQSYPPRREFEPLRSEDAPTRGPSVA